MSREVKKYDENVALPDDDGMSLDSYTERRNARHKDWSLPRRGKSKIATVKPVSKYMTSSEEDLSSIVSDGEGKARRTSLDRNSPRFSRILSKDVNELEKDSLILELEKCLNDLETEQMCNDSLEDDYMKIEGERNELVEELETAFSDLRDYTARVKKAEADKKLIEHERDELSEECEHLKYVLTHRDEVESQKFGWRKEKEKLEKIIDDLESKNTEYKLEIDSLYDERQGLISSLLNLNSSEVNEVIRTRSRTSSIVSTDSAASSVRQKSESDDIQKLIGDEEAASDSETLQKLVGCKRKIQELEGENDDLIDRVDMLESTKTMLEDEREIMQSRIKQLEQDVEKKETWKRDADDKGLQIKSLKEEVKRLTAEQQRKEEDIISIQQSQNEYKMRIDTLENENRSLKDNVKCVQEDHYEAKSKLEEDRKRTADLSKRMDKEKERLEEEVKLLEEQKRNGERKISRLESSLRLFENTKDEYTKMKDENTELNSKIAEVNTKCLEQSNLLAALENEKDELCYQLKKIKEEKSVAVNNLDKANKRISAVCDDLERVHKEKQKLRESLEALQNEHDDSVRKGQKLERELQSVKSENEALRESSRNVTEKKIKELELDLSQKIQELYTEREGLSAQLLSANSLKQDLQDAFQKLESENSVLRSKLKHFEKEKISYPLLIKEKSNLEKYVDNLKAEAERNSKKYEEELTEVKNRLSEFEEAHVSSSRWKKEQETLESTIENLKTDNNKLREQLKRQRLASSSAQELAVNRLRTENESLDRRVEVLQEALNKANTENRSLLERLTKGEESTTSTIRSLKARKNELQMQCSKFQHERDDFEREVNKLRDHINSTNYPEGSFEPRKSESEEAVDELEQHLRNREEELRNAHSKIAELELDNREHTRKLQASEILVLDLQNALARANDLAMEKALEVSRGKRTLTKKIDLISKENTDLKRKLFIDGQKLSSSGQNLAQTFRTVSESEAGKCSSSPDVNIEHTKIISSWSETPQTPKCENINIEQHSKILSDNTLNTMNGLMLSDDSPVRHFRSASQIMNPDGNEHVMESNFVRQNSLPLNPKDNDSRYSFGVIATAGMAQNSPGEKEIPLEENPSNMGTTQKKSSAPAFYDTSRNRTSPKLHRRIQLKQIPFPSLAPNQKVNGGNEKRRMEHWV